MNFVSIRGKTVQILFPIFAILAFAGCVTVGPTTPVTQTLDGGITQVALTIPVTGGKYVKADMYLPASPTPSPGILVFPTYYAMLYGRSENFDRAYALALTKLGYATLVPALSQHGRRAYHPAHGLDMVAISQWFRARPEVMDDRIGGVGFSAGAYHAGVLAASDPATRAIVGYYGPYDSAKFAIWSEDKATALTNYPGKINGAVLLLSGDKDDETVFNQHAEPLNRGLKSAGKNVELVVYPGDYHRFDRGPADVANGNETSTGHVHRLNPASRDDAWRLTTEWLKKYMY